MWGDGCRAASMEEQYKIGYFRVPFGQIYCDVSSTRKITADLLYLASGPFIWATILRRPVNFFAPSASCRCDDPWPTNLLANKLGSENWWFKIEYAALFQTAGPGATSYQVHHDRVHRIITQHNIRSSRRHHPIDTFARPSHARGSFAGPSSCTTFNTNASERKPVTSRGASGDQCITAE